MRRRDFFKGIFGAAIVAAIPKPVMEQLDKMPDETFVPKTLIKPNIDAVPLDSSPHPLLLLYDNEELIGMSHCFSLIFSKGSIDVTKRNDPYPCYIPGPYEWSILVDKMKWANKERGFKYLARNKPFQCAMRSQSPGSLLFQGDVLLTECSLMNPMSDIFEEEIVLKGSGALITKIEIEKNDNSTTKTKIGTAKGAETAIGTINDHPARQFG